jgi:5,10-methenyltetrahydrofolate synthetase
VIVPLLGFNEQCYRLGRGGGYYDRTLEHLPKVLTIGVAYSGQKIDFSTESHDIALDMIVTEKTLLAENSPSKIAP